MTASFTTTTSNTFTLTDAKNLASKIATDLKRLQRLYGGITDTRISEFEAESTALVRAGYLGTVTFGFRRSGNWITPTLRYEARDLAGMLATDDDPGKIRPNADISGAEFHSYLTYSAAWDALTFNSQDAFKKTLPFYRTGAAAPGLVGYFSNDRSYSSGGRALDRSSLRS